VSVTKELVLLVPGLGGHEREYYLELLAKGIIEFGDVSPDLFSDFRPLARQSVGSREFCFDFEDGRKKAISIQEVYWEDLWPSLSKSSLYWRAILGLLVIRYWLNTRLISGSRTSRSMRGLMLFSAGFLLIWYLSTILFVAHSIPSDWIAFPLPAYTHRIIPVVWGVVTLFLAANVTSEMIDLSYGVYSYMADRRGIRERVRRRIAVALRHAAEQTDYDRVTIFAHSFGTMAVVDALADDIAQSLPAMRLITAGSPIEFLNKRDPTVGTTVKQCADQENIREWIDFYSIADAFCSCVPLGNACKKFKAQQIDLGVSRLEAFLGEGHDTYFRHYQILRTLLA
jgi:hypothetical protein